MDGLLVVGIRSLLQRRLRTTDHFPDSLVAPVLTADGASIECNAEQNNERIPAMPLHPALRRLLHAVLILLAIASVHAQPLPAAVNTDPARAQVTLPEPANPALPSLILIGD
jgi:hypothetical protein